MKYILIYFCFHILPLVLSWSECLSPLKIHMLKTPSWWEEGLWEVSGS